MNQNMCSVCGDGKQMANTGDLKKNNWGKVTIAIKGRKKCNNSKR